MDLLWTCVVKMFSNLTQSMGVPLNGATINLASFAVVERPSFSSSSRLCVACNYASIFSCHIRRLRSSCRKRNSVKRLSSSRCCSCLASSRFLSIYSSISSCLLFKIFASFFLSTRNVEYLAFTSFFYCLTDRGDTPWSIFNSCACEMRSHNLPTIFSARLLAISISV